jgi:alkylation response protein AidB-like acyl-CoA dehydrogenase
VPAQENPQNVFQTESEFHDAWLAACTDGNGNLLADETELALAGGAIADRLAWVLVSGYQAAVRRCFPELVTGGGWTCLAAAEGRGGPGCVLSLKGDGYLLSGEKSWIAGAGVLESLVVSVADAEQSDAPCFVGVSAKAPGVALDCPRAPGFLGEMSQGVARFEEVEVAREAVLSEPVRRLHFRGAEPLFVLLALNGCLKAHGAGRSELVAVAERAIEHGRTLPAVLGEKAAILAGLAQLRTLTAATVAAAADVVAASPSLSASWQKDARLFEMFAITGAAAT